MGQRAMAVVLVAVCGVAVSACSREGAGQEGASAGRPTVAVEVAEVSAARVTEAVGVVGTLAPKVAAEVKSEFTAVVRDVYVTEWVPVTRGQPLARLDSREAENAVDTMRAALKQAEVAETRARRELERALKLKDVGLVTEQQLDDARTARDAAQAVTAAARAQLAAVETRLDKVVIRAPIDGVVAERGVNVGDRVENMGSGAPMFRIVDNRLLDLTVSVPSTFSAAVRVGQPLLFTVDALPGKTFEGTVRHINPAVGELDRAVKVTAEVRNDDGALRGGLFVKGRIVTGTREDALLIPRGALLRWDVEKGSGEVFVVTGDVARRRPVAARTVSGDTVEVSEGLAAGDRVVVRGGFNLKDGDQVKVVESAGAV